jgi:hypothetical protein
MRAIAHITAIPVVLDFVVALVSRQPKTLVLLLMLLVTSRNWSDLQWMKNYLS